MARAGVPVDESIDCVGVGSGEATDRLLAVAAAEYRAVNVGANRFQFARTFRPTWALVLGILFLPVLLGALFFLVKSSETWTVTVEEDHRQVRVRVNGRLLPEVLVAIRQALAAGPAPMVMGPPPGLVADAVATPNGIVGVQPGTGVVGMPAPGAAAVPAGTHPAPPAPVMAAPSAMPPPTGNPLAAMPPPTGSPLVALSPPTGAPLSAMPPPSGVHPTTTTPSPIAAPDPSPAPPRSAPVHDRSQEPSVLEDPVADRPVVIPPAPPPGAAGGWGVPAAATPSVPRVSRPHVALRFDTGTVVRATELMLVGRDPSPAADEAAAVLVPLPDPDRSVSKTHLTVGVEGDRLWIVDRGSTNGTVVVHQDGVERIVAPGERVDVPFGASVRMGRRDFTVARADV